MSQKVMDCRAGHLDAQGKQSLPLEASVKRLIARLDVERGKTVMAQAVATYEIDYEKHQERTANHDGDGYLKAELKVAGI